MGELGERAERRVEQRLREALPDDARLYANVPIVARTRHGGPAHDAEADLVLVHPEHGLLVIETKAGEPRLDDHGRWWLGNRQLPRSPFKQAEDAKHDLLPQVSWLVAPSAQTEHPNWMPAAGAQYISSKLDAIASNPAYPAEIAGTVHAPP